MSLPTADEFELFYKAINEKTDDPHFAPFPWQCRLARRAQDGDWPRAIALPTAAGKTACIDIAVFALACRAVEAPRRIFFVVDRRIVVDQAWLHAKRMAEILRDPPPGILTDVAESLLDIAQPGWRGLASDEKKRLRPLDVYELRGGMYRESAWARSPLQPTIVASTVDQVGSRLLFRGYGVSDSMKPIHAGLIGNDSLILLDEAHCARPFDQTIQCVEKYRTWCEDKSPPFRFVSLTATPNTQLAPDQIERDNEDDRKDVVLGPRITASKPARLVPAEKAKGAKGRTELVKQLEKHANELATRFKCVGIIVNRVATARDLKAKLGADAILLTGRMRPLDRDWLIENKLKTLLSDADGEPPRFVVGTQCLECGADFDFHALVTECASLDALRQRFGRLNRVARREAAEAVVVIRSDETADTADDPVYGESLARTWNWLKSKSSGDVFDFGIAAVRSAIGDEDISHLNAPAADAPVLFPAHLDCWIQTHPIPTPDPEPALFLHGPRESRPDVQVVFRDDIRSDWSEADIQRWWSTLNPDVDSNEQRKPTAEKRVDLWRAIVGMCPPSSSEALPVRLSDFRRWLAGLPIGDTSSDLESESEEDVDEEPTGDRIALRWRGPDSTETVGVSHPRDKRVRPGDVFVIPCSAPGVDTLGDFIKDNPTSPPKDYAEDAFLKSRDKACIRLIGLDLDDEDEAFQQRLSDAVGTRLNAHFASWPEKAKHTLLTANLRSAIRHPLGGWIVTARYRLKQFAPAFLEDQESTESTARREVALEQHSRGVAQYARLFAAGCGLDPELYHQAGLWHDVGKLDPRFQAMLKLASPRTAAGAPLAKSARSPRTKEERDQARLVHCYPLGARHELLSAALMAGKSGDDLLLHLIATHHGTARPFAEPVEENDAAGIGCKQQLFDLRPESCRQDIHAWNAELPERFWRVIRRFGWWGAAYREAVFRLADQSESRDEQGLGWEAPANGQPVSPLAEKRSTSSVHQLALPGLDGANPLAFLAAIGALVICDRLSQRDTKPDWLAGRVALSWGTNMLPYVPVLQLPAQPPSPEEFARYLAAQLAQSPNEHPCAWVIDILSSNRDDIGERIRELCLPAQQEDRPYLDWVVALLSETAPDATSQLQTARRDYLLDNIRQVMQLTRADHIERSLFRTWDYADPLANQSLHWEPTEDRRHAYQWHMPSGDPTRKKRGGMLGANRLALEAWPLFPSFAAYQGANARVATRGFRGSRATDTYLTWPIWTSALGADAVGSLVGLELLQCDEPAYAQVHSFTVTSVFRSQRLLVGKTPNFTTARALA